MVSISQTHENIYDLNNFFLFRNKRIAHEYTYLSVAINSAWMSVKFRLMTCYIEIGDREPFYAKFRRWHNYSYLTHQYIVQ